MVWTNRNRIHTYRTDNLWFWMKRDASLRSSMTNQVDSSVTLGYGWDFPRCKVRHYYYQRCNENCLFRNLAYPSLWASCSALFVAIWNVRYLLVHGWSRSTNVTENQQESERQETYLLVNRHLLQFRRLRRYRMNDSVQFIDEWKHKIGLFHRMFNIEMLLIIMPQGNERIDFRQHSRIRRSIALHHTFPLDKHMEMKPEHRRLKSVLENLRAADAGCWLLAVASVRWIRRIRAIPVVVIHWSTSEYSVRANGERQTHFFGGAFSVFRQTLFIFDTLLFSDFRTLLSFLYKINMSQWAIPAVWPSGLRRWF